ncbi:MAG TPA: amino acid adenylation domain-containing protein [Caldithrix abyssi]|uniref:Amino acid adenylation domain-containing protein n=1 Tax=Caldithrix abyssi TaxID=187145 RepID=A0A7V4TZ90_CALAY|nr:amino acid adenylation domain-containing protein [Caldithrix abyssi]
MAKVSNRLSNLTPEQLELLRKKLAQKSGQKTRDQIKPRENQNEHPLSSAQKRLWFLQQLEPESAFYNIPSAIRLSGHLDLSVLEKSINAVINRHEVMRASFKTNEKGEPEQIISEEITVPVRLEDIRHLSEEERSKTEQRLLKEEAATPFDLTVSPLLRILLIRVADEEHILCVNMHHIIADGWSIGVFIQEFSASYRALRHKQDTPLPPLKIQYADYAQWQLDRQKKETLHKQLDFWKNYLQGMPQTLELPIDRKRPPLPSYRGKQHIFRLSKELTKQLRLLAKALNISLYALVMAAFQVFLHKISGQEDFGVGAPIANRNRAEIEQLIGFFVNTIVLRAEFYGDPSFEQLAKRVADDVINASDNQDVPFEQIVEALVPEPDLSRSPLFQVMFDLQKAPLEKFQLDDLQAEIVDIEIGVAKFDLMLLMMEEQERIRCLLEYNTDIFETETAVRFAKYFTILLSRIVNQPAKPVSAYTLLSDSEKKTILYDWNETSRPYPATKSIQELFEKQASLRPERIAIAYDDTRITYQQLNEQANRLAHFLMKQGIEKGVPVSIFMDRSIEMITAILAIIKCGGIYVPIDTTYPKERVAFILEDTGTPVLLTQSAFKNDLPAEGEQQILALDEKEQDILNEAASNPAVRTCADDAAYIIYTSGSTGRPKGVTVPHKAISRLVLNTDYIKITEDDKIAQVSNAAFDAATYEIWGALLNGAQLLGISKGTMLSSKDFIEKIRTLKITQMFLTTAFFNQLAYTQADAFGTLDTLMFGGERVDVNAVHEIITRQPPKRLLHVYGPTENTTFSTWFMIKNIAKDALTVPIGKPIANSTCYVVDKNIEPVPVGVPGELLVGGDGLSLGYHNRPQLSAEKFIPNPFISDTGSRLYRTGDLVRYLPDGNIEFIGRIDQQVKIRGFRIELGEIEALLRDHPDLKDVVVLAREDSPGERRLVGYIVPKSEEPPKFSELRSFLLEKLPDYMVPNIFIPLEALPLTPNGKVDRRALPAPDQSRPELERDYVPPRNKLEQFLAEIWQEVLGIEKVGIHDNFFELGGNSLKAAVFANRLQQELNEVVHVGAVFKAPRISELAMYMVEYIPEFIEQRFGVTAESLSGVVIKLDEDGEVKKINREDLNSFDKIISRLPAAPARNARLPKNKPAVFLLSPPRSGSTLLRVMLAGNPRLFSPPELDLLSFNTLRERRKAFSAKGLEIWLEATIRAVMETKNCSAEEAEKIMAELEEQDLTTREFYGLLQQWLGGDKLIVDKTPTYGFDPNILQRAEEDFDNPFYIHLVRHPYAMIYSFIEAKLDQNFFRYDHPFTRRELAELIWIATNRNVTEFLSKIPEKRQYLIRFEDLLANPKDELMRLCAFLNIPFDDDMLKPYEGKKMTDAVKSGSQMVGDFKFYLHRNINNRVADKWRSYHSTDFLSDLAWEYAETFGYPVEKELARKTAASRRISLTKIEPVPRDGDLQLSFAQQRLWFLEQMEPGSAQYNIPGAIRMKGRLKVDVLECCLNTIIERHETLRTIFDDKDGKAVQIILPKLTLKLQQMDLRSIPEERREEEARRLANEEAGRPFNLKTGPLIRASLIRLAEDDHIFMVVTHHIISDGWSVNLFVQELAALYQAGCRGTTVPMSPLPIQYADFAAWQRTWLSGDYLKGELDFWKKELAGLTPYLELPTDYPRPAVITYEGGRKLHHIQNDLLRDLKRLSQKQETTLFTLLLSAFETLLYRYSGQEDFAVGTPVANRTRAELEPLIGFFVNTLVLRANLSGNPTFVDLLRRNKKITLEAFDHQQIPFEKLVDELQPERDMSHTPLFQVMFSLQQSNLQTVKLDEIEIQPFNMETETAKFDLSLEIIEYKDRLTAIFEYKTGLFKAETIERLIRHFQILLQSIVRQPRAAVSDLPILSPDEKHTLLSKWNARVLAFPQNECIHTLFEQQAARTPAAEAVHFGNRSLSYRELNRQANRLAHHLLKQGVHRETVVAVFMERSVDMLVAIMGILKAGCAYLPLDPAYPQDRLDYMLQDAAVDIICTQEKLLSDLENKSLHTICLDSTASGLEKESAENPQLDISPLNLAYLIYTSGSTGRPKGVMLQHRSALNLSENLYETVYKKTGQNALRISLNAPIPFDASVQQIVMLTRGHALYIVPQEVRTDGAALLDFLRSNKIDVLDCVPSQLKLLLSAGLLEDTDSAPKAILPGGEAIDEATWQTLVHAPGIEFYNMYGPTECTVDSTIFRVKDFPEKPTIGGPVANARFYVLDAFLNPVPPGVPGELYIAGAGLARGYLNRPELTAEKFLPDPFSGEKGARMYASGDLVRWLDGGRLEFLGRVDNQVKVRGFRMELGEIESVLREHEAVDDAVVLARSDNGGEKRLVAYLTGQPEKMPGITALREFLGTKLPDYMIPAVFVTLENFPLLPNGKVNRKALPKPEISREVLESEFVEASAENEIVLAEIWKQVLGVDKVGIKDNFFELGGDSILSIQVIARAKQRGLQITPKQLFENPTIEGLASVAGSVPTVHAEQGPVSGPLVLTPVQRHFFEQNHSNPQHWNQSVLLEVRESLDPEILRKALEAIVAHHDALRLRFVKGDQGWEAFHAEEAGENIFTFLDLSQMAVSEQLAAIEKEANRLQASLDLQNGPIIRSAYFKRSAGQLDRLLLIIHHLAVDGISWRILTEDIQLAYSQAVSGKKILLPPKTTSFKHWAEQLAGYAKSEALKNEKEYWLQPLDKTISLPKDRDGKTNRESDVDQVKITLDKSNTKALLQDVPAVYNTRINDALLTVLVSALQHWTGRKQLWLQLEGHGREDIFEQIDISRTVGWFTTLYPVLLDISGTANAGEALKKVKEQLRNIPQNGIGYGLLRYLTDDKDLQKQMKALPVPELVFNYLGQFDQVVDERSPFRPLSEGMGAERSPDANREQLLDISASIKNGELTIVWNYSREFHDQTTIHRLAADYINELKALIAFCETSKSGGYTVSDFRDADLAEDEIDDLLAELDEN